MSKFPYIGFVLILFMAFLMFTFSFQQLTIADSDNETSIENASRNAMTIAINQGNVRVNEEITINEEIAVEAVLRQYADAADFYDGDRYLNIYKVDSDPAMIAVEALNQVNTPFYRFYNSLRSENVSTEVDTRSREIMIFEAKDLTRN